MFCLMMVIWMKPVMAMRVKRMAKSRRGKRTFLLSPTMTPGPVTLLLHHPLPVTLLLHHPLPVTLLLHHPLPLAVTEPVKTSPLLGGEDVAYLPLVSLVELLPGSLDAVQFPAEPVRTLTVGGRVPVEFLKLESPAHRLVFQHPPLVHIPLLDTIHLPALGLSEAESSLEFPVGILRREIGWNAEEKEEKKEGRSYAAFLTPAFPFLIPQPGLHVLLCLILGLLEPTPCGREPTCRLPTHPVP